MKDNSKYKLGLFFCFAIVIFFAAITLFGVFDYFRDKATVTTIFSESVTGLSLGSSVKYQGVPIGTVKDIFILNSKNQICVTMEIELEQFRVYDPKSKKTAVPSREEIYALLRNSVKNGLRCTMQFEGIAGGKYIQIDNREDGTPVKIPFNLAELGLEHECFIPSEHSTLMNLLSSFSSIADSLKSLDYKNIGEQFSALLGDTKKILESGHKLLDDGDALITSNQIKETLDNINKISAEINEISSNVNKTLTSERLNQIAEDVTSTTKSITELSNAVKSKTDALDVKTLSEETRETLVSFRRTADVLENTMIKLNNGIGAMIELVEHLESDPHFILRGNSENDNSAK